MNTVSTISRSQVKGKFNKSHDFPVYQSSQINEPAAALCECRQPGQDRQGANPGAPIWPLLQESIKVPIPAGHKGRLPLRMYYLLAVLDAHQGNREFCSPSILRLALECRVSERQIIRWLAKLRRLRYIRVDGRGKRNHYRVNRTRNMTPFVFVDPRWVHQLGLSINQAVVLGYVRYKCNGKPESWFSIHRAARDLGLSYITIRRCFAVLAAWEFIEIRPGRQSKGRTNRYQLGSFGRSATGVFEPKRARSKCHLLRNTYPTDSCFYANSVRNSPEISQSDLSFDCRLDQELFDMLCFIGIDRTVARSIAVQWRGYAESVRQAIINAVYRFEADAETLRRHNLAPLRGTWVGYAIGTLNRAYSEGHRVKPSKLVAAAQAIGGDGAAAVPHRCRTKSEFEQRRKEQIRRLRSAPAKPHTPGKSAIPAKNLQFSDKPADNRRLRQAKAIGGRRYFSGRKWAKPAQKLRFSVDSCS